MSGTMTLSRLRQEDHEFKDSQNEKQGVRVMAQQFRALAALREPRFDSQHPRGSSQPYVTPVLEHLMSPSDVCRLSGMHTV